MAAEQKAVESTAKEEVTLTMVKEEASEAVKENHTAAAKEEASAATGLADHSLREAKEGRHSPAIESRSQEREGHSEKIQKEEVSAETVKEETSQETAKEEASQETAKEEALAATDHADHSQREVKENHHSPATESLQDSETQQRRASTRRISTTSVMRMKAE